MNCPRALGADLVEKDVVDIEGGGVEELLLGDDGDGAGEILEFGIEAGAGECAERGVAFVATGGDLERRKGDDFARGGGSAGRGLDGARSLGLVGALGGEFVGVELTVFVLVVFRERLGVGRGRCGQRLGVGGGEREERGREREETARSAGQGSITVHGNSSG